MKLAEGFKMRDVCGSKVLLATGLNRVKFKNMISFNDSAAYLWESLQGKDFTLDTLVSLLMEKYEVEAQRASDDAQALLNAWIEIGLVEE